MVDAVAINKIIQHTGGKENINNFWHCMTRLRFDLIDESKIELEAIKAIPGVLGAQRQQDQFQIIIGPKVNAWYELLVKTLAPEDDSRPASAAQKPRKGLVSLFMDTVSGVFGPIVPAIAGAGMIKGLLAGLIALKVISAKSDTSTLR